MSCMLTCSDYIQNVYVVRYSTTVVVTKDISVLLSQISVIIYFLYKLLNVFSFKLIKTQVLRFTFHKFKFHILSLFP